MTFTLTFKPDFMKDFIRFGRNDQNRIMGCVAELEERPNTVVGNTIKPLRYADNLWRYRFGDNRIIYAVFPNREVVTLLAIGPRDKIYDRLNYDPQSPDLADFTEVLEEVLNPDAEAPPNWADFIRPEPVEETPLTYIFTKNQLQEWGIPEAYHPALMECRTEEAFLDCNIPGMYIEKIIDLMSPPGRIEEIVQKPTLVIDKVDSLQDYSEGKIGLADFLLYLDEEQEKLVDWSLGGPTLVKGGAGSGKSTIALYRARALCELASQQLISPRILFATYTNALINTSRQLLDHLLMEKEVDIEVSTIDSIAMRIYKEVHDNPYMANNEFQEEAIRVGKFALEYTGENRVQNFLMKKQIESLRDTYIKDEIRWIIQGRGITTEQEYLKTDRRGRGYGFNENMRKQIWKIYQRYLAYLENENRITWEMLRCRAYEIISSGETDYEKFDYVLIDEAQDLSPMAIKLCMLLCHSPKGVFLTADAGQSIYNRGFSWNRIHEDLKVRGRTRILKRNYRTTREIAIAANQVLVASEAGDEEVLDQFYVHSGPKPQFFSARNEEEMLYWVYQSITRATHALRLPYSAAAVLSTKNSTAQWIAQELSNLGLPIEYMRGRKLDLQQDCVKSLTIHTTKGLEFPIIAIPYVEEGILPRISDEKAEDLPEEIAHQCRLFYVGCSRAMRRLFVAYREGLRSRYMEDRAYWTESKL